MHNIYVLGKLRNCSKSQCRKCPVEELCQIFDGFCFAQYLAHFAKWLHLYIGNVMLLLYTPLQMWDGRFCAVAFTQRFSFLIQERCNLTNSDISRYSRQLIIPEFGPSRKHKIGFKFCIGMCHWFSSFIPSRSAETSFCSRSHCWLWRPGMPCSRLPCCSWCQ